MGGLLSIIINNSVLLERGHFFEYRGVGSDRIRNYTRRSFINCVSNFSTLLASRVG